MCLILPIVKPHATTIKAGQNTAFKRTYQWVIKGQFWPLIAEVSCIVYNQDIALRSLAA